MNVANLRMGSGLGLISLALAALIVLNAQQICSAQGRVHFEKEVLPILKNTCFQCHSDPAPKKRAKGNLRLDGRHWILKGGSDGRVLSPKEPDKSSLYYRSSLKKDDDDVMPPKGDLLKPQELNKLRDWIRQGADFGTWVGHKPTAKTGAEKTAKSEAKPKEKAFIPPAIAKLNRLAKGLKPMSANAIKRVAGKMAIIEPIALGSPLLSVRFLSHEAEVTNAEVQALAPLRKHIAKLDLRRCRQVNDVAMATVGQMMRLTKLDLAETRVTDRGLYRLTPLKELDSINLYKTKVSDGGLHTLSKLVALEKVTVWQTSATAGGAKQLQNSLRKHSPHARVIWKPKFPKRRK